MATKLILIRHGLTDWGLKKRYCGWQDIPLNKRGRLQALRLKKKLQNEGIAEVYTSNLKRAIQTAEIIFGKSRIKKIPALREINFGIFEGLTYAQALRKHPKIYKRWLNDPFHTVIPEGESLPALKKRVLPALRKIVSRNPDKSVAVVSHGGPISIILADSLKKRDFFKYIPAWASINIIEYKNG